MPCEKNILAILVCTHLKQSKCNRNCTVHPGSG